MKKIAFLVVLLLALPFVFAEDTTDSTDVGAEAGLVVASEHGATIRLLQLAKAVDRAINHAERVIAYAENLSKDTSELAEVLTNFQALQEQIEATDPSSDAAVQEYVALRQEANNLTRTFRQIAHNLLSEEELSELRGYIQSNEYRDNRTQLIRQKICQHNAEQIQFVLDKFNVSAPELVSDVESCNKSAQQARAEMRRVYQSIGQERREEARNQIAENQARMRVKAIAQIEESKNKSRELVEQRRERVQEIRANRSENMQDRMNYSEQNMGRNRTEVNVR